MKGKFFVIATLVLTLALVSCAAPDKFTRYQIDSDTQGLMETVNNIVNTSIVSNDPNVYKAEYEAGFIQGKLQKDQIVAARDNSWDNAYLTDPAHSYPKQIPPTADELKLAQNTLTINWQYTLDYIRQNGNTDVGKKSRRLLYRLVGIYHGAVKDKPEALAFDDAWFPAFTDAEMLATYETKSPTFMDIYFINAFDDLWDVLPNNAPQVSMQQPSKCSAFVKKTADDIYITHNSWMGFLDQSQAMSLWVNGDFLTMNMFAPGVIGSLTDFGYNNKGILFNETTHHATYTEPNTKALWMFWRAALAEEFATSLDEFYQYASLEPSGTYMNGYMIVDAKTNEYGLVEMSYKNFVYFKSDGKGGYIITTKPDGLDKSYDKELLQPDFILGVNYPVSVQIQNDLKAVDTRPARKRQFLAHINLVTDIETAKQLVTYTDSMNPLSVFGRWDLGYGETTTPKTVPDGSDDAKATSVSAIKDVFNLKGVLDTASPYKAFWMKFGAAYINQKPFIWSESQWKGTKLRYVPDRLDGQYVLLNTYMR
ncbi:MAG: hypothetical protein HY741_28620 [Chloroflexi bacterium]|nr:hypothetical protein [Chloroflexota bacterium]